MDTPQSAADSFALSKIFNDAREHDSANFPHVPSNASQIIDALINAEIDFDELRNEWLLPAQIEARFLGSNSPPETKAWGRTMAAIGLADYLASPVDTSIFDPEDQHTVKANRENLLQDQLGRPFCKGVNDYISKSLHENEDFPPSKQALADHVFFLAWRMGLISRESGKSSFLSSQSRWPSSGVEVLAAGVPSAPNQPGKESAFGDLAVCVKIRLRAWSEGLLFEKSNGMQETPALEDLMLCPEPLVPALLKWDQRFEDSMSLAMRTAARNVLQEIDQIIENRNNQRTPPMTLVRGFEPYERRLPHVSWSISSVALFVRTEDGSYSPLTKTDASHEFLSEDIQRALQEHAKNDRANRQPNSNGKKDGGLGFSDGRLLFSGDSASAALYWGFVDLFRGATVPAAPLLGKVTGSGPDSCHFEQVFLLAEKLRVLKEAKRNDKNGFLSEVDRVYLVGSREDLQMEDEEIEALGFELKWEPPGPTYEE